jgi:nicotinic acid phosphoribosyltransferase
MARISSLDTGTPENQIINNAGKRKAIPAFGQRYPAGSKKQRVGRKANKGGATGISSIRIGEQVS